MPNQESNPKSEDAEQPSGKGLSSSVLLAALGSEFATHSTMVARRKTYETLRLRGYAHEESIAAAKQIIHCG